MPNPRFSNTRSIHRFLFPAIVSIMIHSWLLHLSLHPRSGTFQAAQWSASPLSFKIMRYTPTPPEVEPLTPPALPLPITPIMSHHPNKQAPKHDRPMKKIKPSHHSIHPITKPRTITLPNEITLPPVAAPTRITPPSPVVGQTSSDNSPTFRKPHDWLQIANFSRTPPAIIEQARKEFMLEQRKQMGQQLEEELTRWSTSEEGNWIYKKELPIRFHCSPPSPETDPQFLDHPQSWLCSIESFIPQSTPNPTQPELTTPIILSPAISDVLSSIQQATQENKIAIMLNIDHTWVIDPLPSPSSNAANTPDQTIPASPPTPIEQHPVEIKKEVFQIPQSN